MNTKHAPKLDGRYTIQREYCGSAKPQWVVRFCSDWIGCAPSERKARTIAKQHRAMFLASI